ncbi:MAG: beta-lactamase family protein [Chthonomonadales bacterium]|nr:beta-lactamase family protein [Chthonomonadales bacterium]
MPDRETEHKNEHGPAHHQAGHHHHRSTRSIAGLLGLLVAGSAMALAALPSRARDEGPGSGATVRLVSHQGGRPEPAMAAGDEPAARVASRGKSPFSLEGGMEGDARLGVDGQGPDGDILRQEQINGILVTRLGPGIREIDEVFTRMMAFTKMPGAAFVLCYQGRLVYAAGFGYSDLEKSIPFTPYTICMIGSVSKPTASMGVLTFVDDGVLSLNDHPFNILGWRAPDGSLAPEFARVTVKHSLNHEVLLKRVVPREEAAKIFGKAVLDVTVHDIHIASLKDGLAFEPGSKSQYSGYGQSVMARVVEKLSGIRFDQFMQERVFRPLGIDDGVLFTYFDSKEFSKVSTDYEWDSQRQVFAPTGGPKAYGCAPGDGDAVGAIAMSPLSLARFGDRFLDLYRDPARMERMIIDNRGAPNGGYALGWNSVKYGDDKFLLWHGGVIGGWRTELKTGWDGFSYAWSFNAAPAGIGIIPHALCTPAIADDVFRDTGIPRELFPPELQNILQRLRPRLDRQRQVNLWRQAGFPD